MRTNAPGRVLNLNNEMRNWIEFNRLFIVIAMACAPLLMSLPGYAHGNEAGSAKATVGNAKVSIEFRRPTLKGRDLMKLIHPGDLWRLGADVPTTIESDGDLDFGGTRIPRGKYFLLARYVEPGKWNLVVSSKDRQHYEPTAKLAEIPLAVQDGKGPIDAMNIQLASSGNQGNIEIAWGTYQLTASFSQAQ